MAIYLIQEREFIRLNESTYKIGKTKREGLTRYNNYPKGSELLIHIKCDNCDDVEQKIINLFKEKYTKTEYGNEYFNGNSNDMIDDIFKCVKESIIQENINQEVQEKITVVENDKILILLNDIKSFIKDMCDIQDKNLNEKVKIITASDFYNVYVKYCHTNGINPQNMIKVKRYMENLPSVSRVKHKNNFIYKYISFKNS